MNEPPWPRQRGSRFLYTNTADRCNHLESLCALFPAHVQVSNETDELRRHSIGQHIALGKFARQLCRVHARTADVANQDVRLYPVWVDLDAWYLRQPLREKARVGMVLLQFLRSLFQCDQACGRENARLPHSAAKRLAIDPTAVHQFGSIARRLAAECGRRAFRRQAPCDRSDRGPSVRRCLLGVSQLVRPSLSTGRTSRCQPSQRVVTPELPRLRTR